MKTYYAFNLDIYSTSQSPSLYFYSNKPNDIVNRFVAPIIQTNQDVALGNWLTVFQLLSYLVTELKLTSTRTVQEQSRNSIGNAAISKQKIVRCKLWISER